MLNKMINPDLSGKRVLCYSTLLEKKVSLLVLLVFVGVGLLNAQTVIPGGDVIGSWALDSSPYLVEGDITVPNGETLTIDPGVLVEFQGHFALNVQGQLLAIGTAQDSIHFTVVDTTGFHIPTWVVGAWNGIQFEGTPATNDSSKIVHCKLEFSKTIPQWPCLYNGGAIFVNDFSKLLVANCNISNNRARSGGGVSIIGNSNPIFTYNKICYNTVVGDTIDGSTHGGGVCIRDEAAPTFIGNIISNNFNYGITAYGGGVYIGNGSSPLLQGNVIWRNYAHGGYGGGLRILDSAPILINNDIQYNHGIEDENGHMWVIGGAISIFGGANHEIILINNLVANNRGGTGVLHFMGSSVNIILINNTIVDNHADCTIYTMLNQPEITIVNSILSNPDCIEICNDMSGLILTIQNSFIRGGQENIELGAATLNWLEGNIDGEPLFVDAENGYYTLQQNSPCIDAGIAYFEWDGEVWVDMAEDEYYGIAPDMGCYEWEGVNTEDYELPVNHNYQLTNHPNPFTGETTISFSLTTNLHEKARIDIFNIRGQKVKTFDVITNGAEGSVIWNGRDETNKPVSSGIYFYKLVVDGITVDTKKMILLK